MIHRLERRGGRETAAEGQDQPRVGVGQTVLREVPDFKEHVDLDGFLAWGARRPTVPSWPALGKPPSVSIELQGSTAKSLTVAGAQLLAWDARREL
jgi:hypothetical protein